MISPLVVSNELIKKAQNENIVDLTPMKLQKLLYFTAGHYAAKTSESLFPESFMVWQYGPVLASVYYEFSSFGSQAITLYAANAQGQVETLNPNYAGNIPIYTAINEVWEKYKGHTGPQLSNLTHKANAPWANARAKNTSLICDNDLISYFRENLDA